MPIEQDRRISRVVQREQARLWSFIRRRVPDPRDAEDVLQEVFSELVEANRLLMPIEHVTAWLFRVARNRITDLFRKKVPESFSETALADEDGELLRLEDLLPSPDAGPAWSDRRGSLRHPERRKLRRRGPPMLSERPAQVEGLPGRPAHNGREMLRFAIDREGFARAAR